MSAKTLPALLRYQAEVRPDAPAIRQGDADWTYREFYANAQRLAQGLAGAGIGPGDRVAYIGKNSCSYFEILFGASLLGAVAVPINWRLSEIEVGHILVDSKAKLRFVESDYLQLAGSGDGCIEIPMRDDGRGLAAWLGGFEPIDPGYNPPPEETVLQLYTSGTTGLPKGVMLTHRNLLAQREQQRLAGVEWDLWSDEDANLVSMPIAHISGTGWSLYGFYNGARNIVVREFDPSAILRLIARERVSRMFVVPAALKLLLDAPEIGETDVSSLRFILYGGSPITEDVLARALATFSCGMVQLYGMTESTGAATALSPSDHVAAMPDRLRSAGRPLPGVEIAIRTPDGGRASACVLGEILIRGAGVMAGYWNRPDATGETIEGAGWLRTGDVGMIDADGYLHVRDRLKDMIISGGENVYAGEVETVLARHPAVAEVAVVGVPDRRWGEAVKAFVVRQAGASLEADDLIAWTREQLAGYKTPKHVAFVEALPRNPSGKILKRVLREGSAGA